MPQNVGLRVRNVSCHALYGKQRMPRAAQTNPWSAPAAGEANLCHLMGYI